MPASLAGVSCRFYHAGPGRCFACSGFSCQAPEAALASPASRGRGPGCSICLQRAGVTCARSREGSSTASEVLELWEGAQGGSPVSASEPRHEALNGSPLDICLRGLPLRREASAAVQFPLLPELLSWCLQHTRVSHLRCLCLSSPVSTWLRGWTSCGTCFGAFPQAGCLESQLALGAQILPDWVVNPQMMSVGFQLRAPCSPPSRCEDLLCLWPRVSWEAFVPGKRCAENV